MKRLKKWWHVKWNLRFYRRTLRNLDKLKPATQLGIAQSIIAAAATPLPRSARSKFLVLQAKKVEELCKTLVSNNKESR